MALFPRYDGPQLIEQICAVPNMTLAWRRVLNNIHAARRDKSAGPDAVTLRDFEADWPHQMAQLVDELRTGRYQPLPPRRVGIPKRSGGERAIAILAVRDRVAQRAVQQVLEPLFDPYFLDCSYGCRPLVGVPHAIARVERYAAQGFVWVVDADIAGYFDAIDHRILLGLVRQRVDDPAILRLIAQWLVAGALNTPETPTAPRGLLARGEQAVREAAAWGNEQVRRVGMPEVDPYAASQWEAADGYGAPTPESRLSLNHLMTAASLAKPALDVARRAVPYVQKIGGTRLLAAGAIAAGVLAAGELALRSLDTGARGTPQGGALSPLLANIYLHPFDLALTSQGLRLIRFVDDMVVMCADQPEAERVHLLVERQLGTLRLNLNSEKTRVTNYTDGLEFLGEALAPRRRGPRLPEGLTSFEEAQRAMQTTASKVKQKLKRG